MVSEANVYLRYCKCIKAITMATCMLFRDGADEMFDVLDKNDVPLLIFSAGIGGWYSEILNKTEIGLPARVAIIVI